MEIRVQSLKIISKINVDFNVIEKEILNIKGVIDSKIKESGESYILNYALDNWASEYDVMVSIMELLDKEFSLESEPLFYDEEENIEFDYSEENIEKNYPLQDYEEEIVSKNEPIEQNTEVFDKKGHSHNEEEHVNPKTKILELSIAFIIFIAGIILNAIPSTKMMAKYFYVIAYSVAGYEVIFEGLIGVFKGKVFSEFFLMTIASIAAIILGKTAEAFGIMFLFSIGELFEHVATDNSNKVINGLKQMCPQTVSVRKGEKIVTTAVENVEVGDVIVLRAGDRVAIDGVILSGSASFDTKTITGESKNKDLEAGDTVFGGYINIDGYVEVEATKTYENSSIAKIMEIVENSAIKKSKKESFIEKFARWYTPLVMILALLIVFIPPIFDEVYLDGLKVWEIRGIMLLCVSCPCALIISVPLTYFCGVGLLAKNGVLVKSTNTLEKLASCNTVVFDKTGTLTKGNLTVKSIVATKEFSGKLLERIAILEQNSNHPIANAIKEKAKVKRVELEEFKEIAGKGIIAKYEGKTHILGKYKFLVENGIEFKENEELGTKVYLAVDGKYAGCVILTDEIRNEAYGAIRELKDYGIIRTVMLTGDSREYAKAIRKELEMTTSVSELKPEDKVVEIEKLISENDKNSVAYVGDGINDAPVITRADVGFSMGSFGSDSAIESSDIVLTDDDLSKVPFTVMIAKRTNGIAKQNILASLLVKFIVMILGIAGLSSSLWLAISADVGIMILAVLNAIRNRFY